MGLSLKSIGKGVKKVFKGVKKVAKGATKLVTHPADWAKSVGSQAGKAWEAVDDFALPILGTALLGPAGGALGGALAKGIGDGRPNLGRIASGAVSGAATGGTFGGAAKALSSGGVAALGKQIAGNGIGDIAKRAASGYVTGGTRGALGNVVGGGGGGGVPLLNQQISSTLASVVPGAGSTAASTAGTMSTLGKIANSPLTPALLEFGGSVLSGIGQGRQADQDRNENRRQFDLDYGLRKHASDVEDEERQRKLQSLQATQPLRQAIMQMIAQRFGLPAGGVPSLPGMPGNMADLLRGQAPPPPSPGALGAAPAMPPAMPPGLPPNAAPAARPDPAMLRAMLQRAQHLF